MVQERRDRKAKMTTDVKVDGEGFLAKVRGRNNLYAFGYSTEEALKELGNVIEMIADYNWSK